MTPRNVILPRVNVIPAPFTNPEALTTNSLNDTCLGGKALGDGSKGRTFQLWYARYENGEITKYKYENYVRNPDKNPIGDWNCAYCSYSDTCKAQKKIDGHK